MKKDFLRILLFSFFGGAVGALSFGYISGKYSANISETIVPVPIVSVIPSLGFWEKIISENSSTAVSIQVFQANQAIRQGNGIIVSSDGLVVTAADLAVTDGVYQIFYDDEILQGTVASRDYKRNLLLIKTDYSYPNVVDLSAENYNNGQEIVLIGKMLDFSKSRIYSQRGTISYITDKNVIIDAVVNRNLYGYAVLNRESDFLGLSYLRNGKINLATASAIQDFLQDYLAKSNK